MAIGTTAAILGAAAIGTAGSLAAGGMQAGAAEDAANAQVEAARLSAQVQRDAATQARIDAYPWALAGAQSLYAYMGELGIPMPQTPILPDLTQGPFAPGATGTTGGTTQPTQPAQPPAQQTNTLTQPQQPYYSSSGGMGQDQMNGLGGQPPTAPVQPQTPATPPPTTPSPFKPVNQIPMTKALGFRETPGYQFQVQEGERGVMNNLAALGMKNSGAALKALTRFRTGLADQEYGNYLNRLAAAAGMGQVQTNQTNALTSNAAGNIGRAYQDAGAARASGYVGAGNAWGNAIGGMTNTWSNALGSLAFMK